MFVIWKRIFTFIGEGGHIIKNRHFAGFNLCCAPRDLNRGSTISSRRFCPTGEVSPQVTKGVNPMSVFSGNPHPRFAVPRPHGAEPCYLELVSTGGDEAPAQKRMAAFCRGGCWCRDCPTVCTRSSIRTAITIIPIYSNFICTALCQIISVC